MVSYSILRLENSNDDDDIDRMANICVEAFRDHDSILMINGQNREHLFAYFRAEIAAACLDGEVYIAVLDDTRVIVSLTVWFPPGKALNATEEQRQQGLYDWQSKLDPATKEFVSTTFPKVIDQFFSSSLGSRSELDNWVCYLAATDLAYQNQGIGTALAKDIFQRVTDKGAIFCLCTTKDSNVKWYEKLGYTVVGYIPKVEAPKGSCPIWVLRKDVI